jgi:hypothetical protein
MKTRMLAIAFERGRVGARRAQAWGFVSSTMTRSDGEGPVKLSGRDLERREIQVPSIARS